MEFHKMVLPTASTNSSQVFLSFDFYKGSQATCSHGPTVSLVQQHRWNQFVHGTEGLIPAVCGRQAQPYYRSHAVVLGFHRGLESLTMLGGRSVLQPVLKNIVV